MSFEQRLNNIIDNFKLIESKLMDPSKLTSAEFTSCSKEHAKLLPISELATAYLKLIADIKGNEEILADLAQDPDMKELAEDDLKNSQKQLAELKNQLKIALLPKDDADEKNAILEIRSGTGGEEAALFAAVLLRMYQRYADSKGWKFEVLNLTETGLDGIKEASILVHGASAFSKLKYESGVHRVQRIPETESSGRIHTSAATVAVLPEAEDVDIEIEDKDIRIDVFRASGAGGQHVNTTDSAVRITHIPTGVVVSQQDEKSQHKNKAKALKILRSRLFDAKRQAQDDERSSMRKSMVGSGDRSERIRTYNFPQSRVTDHRINLTKYNLDEVINEGSLDEFINALITEDQAKKLAQSEGD